jgi:hypothetical protein
MGMNYIIGIHEVLVAMAFIFPAGMQDETLKEES